MSKKILRIEFDFAISLIGISSTAKDYRLCWFLNKSLPFEFSRVEDLLLEIDEEEEAYFSRFQTRMPNLDTELFLLANKSHNGYLIPENKETDFFIISTEILPTAEQKNLLKTINKIEVVQSAYLIDPQTLKSKDNLMFF